MTAFGNQTICNEFSCLIDDLIGSGKSKLANFLDHYFNEGNTFSELQNKIEGKTPELKYKGYSFNNNMQFENTAPKQILVLGYIMVKDPLVDYDRSKYENLEQRGALCLN